MNESTPFTKAPTPPRQTRVERALISACLRIPWLEHWARRRLARWHIRCVKWHERNGTAVPSSARGLDHGWCDWGDDY